MTAQKTCFVVQGFGEKTDLATGRALNLDASYEVIKEAVQAAGLRCVRADEILHSGTIDAPMYDQLFRADLVIADLSTSNLNAVYELGVRYGVRPRATIIVAEQQFKNPFDFSHIVIRRYEHLGSDVGRREATRFKAELTEAIRQIVDGDDVDSPVYTFLRLEPPADPATVVVRPPTDSGRSEALGLSGASPCQRQRPKRRPRAPNNFSTSRAPRWRATTSTRPAGCSRRCCRCGLVTSTSCRSSRSRRTSRANRTHAARSSPRASTCGSSIPTSRTTRKRSGLWGAIHKRLWDIDQDRASLDVAVNAYERGFYLKQDYYNGINLAFLLNVRASVQQAE